MPADFTDEVSHGESERFLTCSDDLSIMELDLSNNTIAVNHTYPNSHENHILSMELNPFADHMDPKSIVLASAGSDCNIKLWTLDMKERKIVPCAVLKGHDRLVRCVRFPAPDTLISCAHDSTVRVWDIPGGTLRTVLTCSEDNIDVMDFDMITPTVLACSCSDGTVKFWDIETEKMIFVLQDAHLDAVRRVRVLRLPDDHPTSWDAIRTLGATINHPRTFDEWITLRQKAQEGHHSDEDDSHVDIDIPGLSLRTRWNTLIVTCSYDRSLKVWSLATLKELPFALPGLSNELGQFSALEVYPIVGLHHNNAVLVTGSYDHRVRFWDLNTGNVVRTLSGHAGIPCIAKLWRDRVISVGTDGTVNEWRPRPMVRCFVLTSFDFLCSDGIFCRARKLPRRCFSTRATPGKRCSRKLPHLMFWIN
jgi:WD40 repeat protein